MEIVGSVLYTLSQPHTEIKLIISIVVDIVNIYRMYLEIEEVHSNTGQSFFFYSCSSWLILSYDSILSSFVESIIKLQIDLKRVFQDHLPSSFN